MATMRTNKGQIRKHEDNDNTIQLALSIEFMEWFMLSDYMNFCSQSFPWISVSQFRPQNLFPLPKVWKGNFWFPYVKFGITTFHSHFPKFGSRSQIPKSPSRSPLYCTKANFGKEIYYQHTITTIHYIWSSVKSSLSKSIHDTFISNQKFLKHLCRRVIFVFGQFLWTSSKINLAVNQHWLDDEFWCIYRTSFKEYDDAKDAN